jgi:hypothetical protein
MRTIITAAVGAVLLAGTLGWVGLQNRGRMSPQVAEFQSDSDNLIQGLQQYKEFVGTYPPGNSVEVAKALSGQTDKKVLILATSKNKKNAKGEIVDPWGTPIQFYFAQNGVLIRSAGPNRVFEDSSAKSSDDLFRTEIK